MNIREALHSKLLGTTAITDLVGTRIYPRRLPQNATLPAITHHLISESPHHAMGSDAGVYSPRFQVSSWGATYDSVQDVATAVKTALKDSSGLWGGGSGVTVQRCMFEYEIELFDPLTTEEMDVFHVSQDYIIWHE